MDIKEIAPLVIFGAIFLIRALAGGKKAKKRRPAPSTTTPRPKREESSGNDIKDAIEEIVRTYKQEKQSTPVAVKHEEAMATEEREYNIESIEYESREKIKKEHTGKHRPKKQKTPGLEIEELDNDFEFDAGMAVIYSEIMKRPEW